MNREPRTALDALGRAPRLRLAWLRAILVAGVSIAAATRRLLDLGVSLTLSFLTFPVFVLAAVVAAARDRPVFVSQPYLGRWQRPIELGFVPAPGLFARIPWLWAVVRGDLALVGPAPLPESERPALDPADIPRFTVRPGLAHLFGVRRAANIAFEGRTEVDLEQVHATTLGGELGILLRSIPAALLGAPEAMPPSELNLLDIRIDNWTMTSAIDWLLATPQSAAAHQLAFVNPDCLNKAFERPSYRQVLAAAAVVLPDGIGIHYACRMMGTSLAANVNGTDLFPRLCEALEGTGKGVFFLGARPDVIEALLLRTRERWPRLYIAGAHHGFFNRGTDEEAEVIQAINQSGADLLLVAFGAPAQDEWIAAHRMELHIRMALGVGGLFDFYSGRIRRAPAWMRELGLEWTWRLLQEPGRMWRRYIIGNPLFLWRVWKWSRSRRYV